ncbi:MAG: hypothetical protein C0608_07565 [Deltaproteobacteria bacterium]|nr:MAG: hypothetical protein C0608_07565 [Deltaproteobacteria bacterium]
MSKYGFISAVSAAVALVLLIGTTPAFSVSCHCFRDRTYESAEPFLADPYILATARNSFVALAAGVSKSDVVKERMGGAGEADVWLTDYLGKKTGVDPEKIKEAHSEGRSWEEAFNALRLDTSRFGEEFDAARRAGDADAMSAALADIELIKTFGVSRETLSKLRESGADNAEAILALLVAKLSNGDPMEHLLAVSPEGKSWGALLDGVGVMPAGVGEQLGKLYK